MQNPIYGTFEIPCRKRFETVPNEVRRSRPAPYLTGGGMRGAVATSKEQLLARPREGERAG